MSEGEGVLIGQADPRAQAVTARREAGHAAKYAIVGVLNVAIDFVFYALLVSFGVWYVIAKAISLTLATANGYTWNRRWTFRVGRHKRPMLTKYVTVQAGCYLANVAILAALVEGLDLGAVTAQAIAVPFVSAISFAGQRLWTFGAALS